MNKETLDKIIAKLGINGLSEEDQLRIINALEEKILSRVNVAIIETLDESLHQQLLDLANQGDEKVLNQFLEAHIPDFRGFVKKHAQEVVKEYLNSKL